MNRKIILFDIDYTLLDTTRLKELIADALVMLVPHTNFQIVDEIYYEVRQSGAFNPKLFARLFKDKQAAEVAEEKIEHLWYDQSLIQKAIYPEVISTLRTLQRYSNMILGIFSSGRTEFQLAKISSLYDFFTQNHIHIADFKDEILSDVLKEYKSENVWLIDDFIPVLHKAKSIKPDLFAIWMKRGKFALQAEIPVGSEPDATITNLTEIVSLLDNETI